MLCGHGLNFVLEVAVKPTTLKGRCDRSAWNLSASHGGHPSSNMVGVSWSRVRVLLVLLTFPPEKMAQKNEAPRAPADRRKQANGTTSSSIVNAEPQPTPERAK